MFLFNWIERYPEAASRLVVLHIHLAFILEDGRLDLVDVQLIANVDLDDFVSEYLIFIVGLGKRRGWDDSVDELSHVYALLEERFEDIAVGALV